MQMWWLHQLSQNDHQFEQSLPIPPANIKSRLDVIATDSCQAVKVGMLPNNESVKIVSKYFLVTDFLSDLDQF